MCLIQHIRETCDLSYGKVIPTIQYEDSAACISQLRDGYVKEYRTKYTSPKFFFIQDLQRHGDINIHQVDSSDNLADLLNEALLTAIFEKLVRNIGVRQLKDLN